MRIDGKSSTVIETGDATGAVRVRRGCRSVARPTPLVIARPNWDMQYADGRFCRRGVTTTDGEMARLLGPSSALAVRLPDCAPRPSRTPAEAADALARRFWDMRLLPAPTLQVVPDYAITGKLVYLQIGGDAARRFDVANPLGDDVTIDATSHYVVDWGDGTKETTNSQGGAWPGGDVAHGFTDAGDVTITVTQVWSAAWQAGGAGGELAGLRTSSSLPLRVTQLQAVRNR